MKRRLLRAAAGGFIVIGSAGCGHHTTTTSRPVTPNGTTTPAATSPTNPGDDNSTSPSTTAVPSMSGTTYVSNSLPPNFSALSEVPVTTGPGHSTNDVTVITPTAADDATFAAIVSYPASTTPPTGGCVAKTVPDTVHIATVKHTGISWALAGFAAVSGCTDSSFFSRLPPPPVGVFERQPGGKWRFNSEDGKPYPCPEDNNDAEAGPGSDYIPPEVFTAWQMPYYSPGCSTYVAPEPGQGH